MAALVKVSEAASIALHACLWLARAREGYCRAGAVCGALGFSPAHFAKVMRALARAGLVASGRGPAGGSRLARPAAQITLLELYEAVDGPARVERCLLAPNRCPASGCKLGAAFARHNAQLRRTLASTTLAGLARAFRARRLRAGKARAGKARAGKARAARFSAGRVK